MQFGRMNNTEAYIVDALKLRGSLTCHAIAKMRWPQSRQLHKKAKTIERYCNRLVHYGFLLQIGDGYCLTAAGDGAADVAADGERPPILSLARFFQ